MKTNNFIQNTFMDKTARILSKTLDLRSANHKVISGNLANVDTPGYRPKELQFEQELQRATEKNGQRLSTTDPDHFPTSSSDIINEDFSIGSLIKEGDKSAQLNLDTEMAKMSRNNLLYETSVTLLSNKLKLLKTAIQGQ